jgi:DNA-directed RNA polymerase specialized sigma24 family protein
MAAEFAAELERRFADLGNPTLRTIALRKLDGHSSVEIAAELGITARTVDRTLEMIREIWTRSRA